MQKISGWFSLNNLYLYFQCHMYPGTVTIHVPRLPLWSWGGLGDFELHFHLALHLLILNMIYGVILHINQEGHRKALSHLPRASILFIFISLSLKWRGGRWHSNQSKFLLFRHCTTKEVLPNFYLIVQFHLTNIFFHTWISSLEQFTQLLDFMKDSFKILD